MQHKAKILEANRVLNARIDQEKILGRVNRSRPKATTKVNRSTSGRHTAREKPQVVQGTIILEEETNEVWWVANRDLLFWTI